MLLIVKDTAKPFKEKNMKKMLLCFTLALFLIAVGITVSYSQTYYPFSYFLLITAGIFIGIVIKSI